MTVEEIAALEPRCEHCGHRMIFHGDRAVTACDGGWAPLNRQLQPPKRPAEIRSQCYCPGWKRSV